MAFAPVLAAAWAQAGRQTMRSSSLIDSVWSGSNTPDDDASGRHRVVSRGGVHRAGHTRLAATSLRFLGEVGLASDGIVDHIGAFYLGARDGYRGGLLHLLGELDAAVESLRRASVVNRRIGAIVFAIKTDLDLAEVLLDRGTHDDSQKLPTSWTAPRPCSPGSTSRTNNAVAIACGRNGD
jgi:hypothetical protein